MCQRNSKDRISIHAPREGCDDLRSGFFGLNTISIHAPREGCDPVFANIGEQPILFQSTHPARGATRTPLSVSNSPMHFNPRTPRGVRQGSREYWLWLRNFNPRTPRGVRLKRMRRTMTMRRFQSTHPARGATDKYSSAYPHLLRFQSTHPARGATIKGGNIFLCHRLFQSTHPARGATGEAYRPVGHIHRCISIHAPREGCDWAGLPWPIPTAVISIHAPREGCDAALIKFSQCQDIFQSTHPARGATHLLQSGSITSVISIHAPREGCDLKH